MKRALRLAVAGTALLAIVLFQRAATPLGAAAPDFFLAATLAAPFLRRGSGGVVSLGLGGLRSSLSIDPVLPTLGFFLLAGEGASLMGSTFYGERAVLPSLLGFSAGLLAPLLRSLSPVGPPLPGAAELLLSAAGTAAASAAATAGGLVLRKLLR